MPQIAVFVDAGYLYAQGSKLLMGKKAGRESISLKVPDVLEQLTDLARAVATDCRLLRIYWYDGMLRGNIPTLEQDVIGQSRNAKLRLGLVNSSGQQKGVDSLIVTDLIELARNRAIADSLILSGDEDIKIGVQVAQTFGVRVHLLGIKPARGSQSVSLMMEADTCHEWDEGIISKCMECADDATDIQLRPSASIAGTDNSLASLSSSTSGKFQQTVTDTVNELVGRLTPSDLERHVQYLDANMNRIHSDIDRPTLGSLRNHLGRDLTELERKEYRQELAALLRSAQDLQNNRLDTARSGGL